MLDHIGIKCFSTGKKERFPEYHPLAITFSYEIPPFYLLPAAGLPADRH